MNHTIHTKIARVFVLLVNYSLDSMFYGQSVFPPLRFLMFNVLQSLSHFYGTSPWHYYLSQSLPILLIGYLPLALYSLWKSFRNATFSVERQLTSMIFFVIPVFSLIAHKEVRFIYPLLPAIHTLIAAIGLPFLPRTWSKRWILWGMLGINAIVALYATQVHQRGVIDVVTWLRKEYYEELSQNASYTSSVGFLMPCHSTPWTSYLQGAAENSWALTCEPPIGLSLAERVEYYDEADQFYKLGIERFLKINFPPALMHENPIMGGQQEVFKYTWPDKLIMFEPATREVGEYVGLNKGSRYREVCYFDQVLYYEVCRHNQGTDCVTV